MTAVDSQNSVHSSSNWEPNSDIEAGRLYNKKSSFSDELISVQHRGNTGNPIGLRNRQRYRRDTEWKW